MSVKRELARARRALRAWAELASRPEAELAARPPRSRWSVAQHAHHSLIAEKGILALVARLAREGDAPRGPGPTLSGRAVLALRWIPRGRGQAPEHVLPEEQPSPATLRALVEENAHALDELERIAPAVAAARARRSHHVFGGLDAARWLRYVSIHDEHHLRIVAGRARAASAAPSAQSV